MLSSPKTNSLFFSVFQASASTRMASRRSSMNRSIPWTLRPIPSTSSSASYARVCIFPPSPRSKSRSCSCIAASLPSALPSACSQSLLLSVVVLVFWLAATIASLLNCRPLKYSCMPLSVKEHCFDYNIFLMATGAVEIVIDTVIRALPVRMMGGLQLSRKSKGSI